MSFTKIQNSFIERHDLSPEAKIVAMYLYGRRRNDGQPWQIDREQIAGAVGLSLRSIKGALVELRDAGLITDNRKSVRGADGRMRRPKATVVQSRRSGVVQPDASAGRTEGPKRTYGFGPSNEQLSNEGLSNDSSADTSADADTPSIVRRSAHDLGRSANSPAEENNDDVSYPGDGYSWSGDPLEERRSRCKTREAKDERDEAPRTTWRELLG